MLQDIEAGRKTEVEVFAGKVVSMGLEYGVSTPVNQTILHIIKEMENRALSARLP
jgi:2-dehydropantoate 2-reductase